MLTLITNSLTPYCFDVPRVLGLPLGAIYRFRYHKKWIENTINTRSLIGQSAVIVLRDLEHATLIPIRFVTITKIRNFGDISWIEFVVGNYVRSISRNAIIKKLADSLEKKGAVNSPNTTLTPLVFSVDDLKDLNETFDESTTAQLWDEISNKVGELNVYREYSFFRLVSIKDSAGIDVLLVSGETPKSKVFGIKPGELYFIEILQKIPFKLADTEQIETPFVVELSCPANQISLIRRVQKVVGKYDLLQFSFRTTNIEAHAFAEVYLETKQGQAVDSGAPFLSISFSIVPSMRRHILTVIQFAALGIGGWLYVKSDQKFLGVLLLAFGIQGFRDFLKKWIESGIKGNELKTTETAPETHQQHV